MDQVRLAFSGSGFLAPIHAGAVCAFLDAGVEIVEVAGTSGGAIVAALVAAGKTSTEIKMIALRSPPKGIMRYQPFAIWRKAINEGTLLQAWLDEMIGETCFGGAKIPITIVATDIKAGAGYVFTREKTPHHRLSTACRASASVPFVWTPKKLGGVTLCDGGMINNIPTDKLISDDIPRIGIQVEDGGSAGAVDSLLGFAKQCIGTLLSANENNLVAWAEQTGATIIPVSALPYGFLDSGLPLAAREELFQRGYEAATKLFLSS